MGQLFLGVDGGGTKCRMRLSDQNFDILAEAVITTPANLQIRGGDAAFAAINQLTKIIFAKAGLNIADAAKTHACFGMAGARMKSARDNFASRGFPFASVQVFDDIDIARAGAHLGEDGAVLIIGTGSAGMGLLGGKRLQIGGWGFLLGDTMAGATLGRELLRISLLASEGIVEGSPMTEAVMAQFDNQQEKLMTWSFENAAAFEEAQQLYADRSNADPVGNLHARPGDYGRFVPMIFDYLERGDPIAKSLYQFELDAIELYVRWFVKNGINSIAIVGGLGQRLFPILQKIYPDNMVDPKADPLQGALVLAVQSVTQAA